MRKSIPMLLALPLLLVGCAGGHDAAGLRVRELGLSESGGRLVIEPRLALSLTAPIERALDNGVAVTLLMEARVTRARAWLWPATEVEKTRRYTLLYHSLSEQYLVREGKQTPRAFPSRLAALSALSEPGPWPLAETAALAGDGRYRAALRVSVDLQSLPAPLRLMAYFSPAWHVGSKWQSEELEP